MFKRIGPRVEGAYSLPQPLTIEQWAAENVVFTDTSVSPIPGPFKIENSYHMSKVFEALDRREVRETYCKFASQLGKSLITMIYGGWKLSQNPAFIGYFVPVESNLSRIVRAKIDPVLRSMPEVWKMFQNYRFSISDDDEQSQRGRGKMSMKLCPGGGLLISGSSASNRKSVTLQSIIFDECGEMDNTVVEEASERVKSYLKFFPKILAVSTIVSPDDAICTSYDRAECQLEYHYVCPHCDGTFYPDSTSFFWPKREDHEDLDESDYVRLLDEGSAVVCPHCDYHIHEAERQVMLFAGRGMKWVVVKGDWDRARTIGFSANSLHSAFVPLGSVANKLYKISQSATSEEELEVFYRGWFNEFYRVSDEETTDAMMVVERAGEEIDLFTVPDDTVAVYLGVDVQKDHFWYTIRAYREKGHDTIIAAGRIESFGDVGDLMDIELFYADGERYMPGIRRTGIDLQGYVETERIYDEKAGREISVVTKNIPEETRMFVLEQSEIRGLDNDFERIYGVKGTDFLPDESMFRIASQQLKLEHWNKERTFKFIKMGSVSAKLSFMSKLNRTIFNHKGARTTISSKLLENFGGERDRFHIAHQLTSEIYTWDHESKGKKLKRKTFIRIKKQNHLFDCCAIIECLAAMDRVDRLRSTKPKTNQKAVDLKSLFVIK